jgi:cyclopropane fatty-acyl-phospholipid synthase-like methyltransferase
MKSDDVKYIYNRNYFLESVDGCKEFNIFNGSYDSLFDRYKRNISLLDLKPYHRFLEIGCGRGEICIYHSLSGGDATGIDYSKDAIKLARMKAVELNANSKFIESSFSCLTEEVLFDRILASEFIEHVSKEEGIDFFARIRRALNRDGKLLIYTYPNTLQRRYGYPILRFVSFLYGKCLPPKQPDTLSEHYRLYHLNEQNFFSLKETALRAGFKKIYISYDCTFSKKNNFTKNIAVGIIKNTPLRHIFLTGLYIIAEK